MSEKSTEEVVNNHLEVFAKGDLDGIVSDFSDEAVFFKMDGVLRGKKEIRKLFKELLKLMPTGSDIQIEQLFIEGELAYLYWSGESEHARIPFATDTIIVRDGKIVKQTFAALIKTKT